LWKWYRRRGRIATLTASIMVIPCLINESIRYPCWEIVFREKGFLLGSRYCNGLSKRGFKRRIPEQLKKLS